MKTQNIALLAALLSLAILGSVIGVTSSNRQQPTKLVVHEWGTMTTQHTADGKQLGGLNSVVDGGPLPRFVHRHDERRFRPRLGKGPGFRPIDSVTMRLETPVVYFYPTKHFKSSDRIDLSVGFRGGVLNEYYPRGDLTFSKLFHNRRVVMSEETSSVLFWKGIRLGDDWTGPKTLNRVWLAPRKVRASGLRMPNGETEKYLFYRGLAHLKPMIRTTHNVAKNQLVLFNPAATAGFRHNGLRIPAIWLVRTKHDGSLAFRRLKSLRLSRSRAPLRTLSTAFKPTDYRKENLQSLYISMERALISDGLYKDEAQAMLNTWRHSYFLKPGARLLFVMPKTWANHYLPMTISLRHQIERVYVGRIDLLGFQG